jgi:lipoprotein-releasing system ATP-binding protein
MEEVLNASGLAKSFTSPRKLTVLKDISLTVRRGQSVAIVGRSGEGKSTLLQILGTLEKADRGALTIAGSQVTSDNPSTLRLNHIGFIFQSFHLFDHYTALENILLPARIARKNTGKRSAARARALELLEAVDLTDRAHHASRLLSGGEKQRVAMARALMNEPDLLLADEPTGNLDYKTSTQLQELLISFSRESNKGLIVVTHDQELSDRCDETYTLLDGVLTPKRK